MDPQLVTLTVTIIGAIGTVIAFIAGKRERSANAMSQEGAAAAKISEGFANLVKSLEIRVQCLEDDKDEQAKEIKVLQSENITLKIDVQKLELDKRILSAQITALEAERSRLETRIVELERTLTSNGLTNDTD